jgi:predicted short-subunit dehydrogenase-like oxidoreductase (DUF2520 family)
MTMRARCIGPGRAGRSLSAALRRKGWDIEMVERDQPVTNAAGDVDVVLLTVPDDAIAEVARAIVPTPTTVVCHVSGSRTLDVLAPHPRRASLHPLAPLPDADTGVERLLSGMSFAVAGDPVAWRIVADLGGRAFEVDDHQRARYHATAAVASNHLVALTAQVERLAAAAGVPADAFWPLARAALDDVTRLGAAAALTGPAARGDHATVRAHLDAIPAAEVALYRTLAAQAARLAGRELPDLTEEPVG